MQYSRLAIQHDNIGYDVTDYCIPACTGPTQHQQRRALLPISRYCNTTYCAIWLAFITKLLTGSVPAI